MAGKTGSHIVVGVDGSEPSLQAVRWAAQEAALRRRPLRLVTVVGTPPVGYVDGMAVPPNVFEINSAEGREILARAVDAASRVSTDIEISRVLRQEPVTRGLLEQSDKVFLLVLGTRGFGQFARIAVGSTAGTVAVHARCPVAVIRGHEPDAEPPRHGAVLVGVDSSPVREHALAMAFDEASIRRAPLVALHAWSDVPTESWFRKTSELDWDDVEQRQQAVLAERLAGWQEDYPDVAVQRVVVRDRPVRYLVEHGADAQLIVVGSRGRGGLTGILLGSTSQALLHAAPCPLLIVRHRW